MAQGLVILNQVLPIFLLIGIGILARRAGLLTETTVDALKMLVVRLVLPAVLFLSFTDMELKPNYFGVFVLVFAVCVAGYVLGRVLLRAVGFSRPYAPYLMAGYEYGMLGISLFAGAYGFEAIGTIAVIALGHEIFIWFVFFTLLLIARDGGTSAAAVVPQFFKNPVIIAIFAGIALNLLGIHTATLDALPVAGALTKTLRFLAPLTVPLILIIVGFGMHVERQGLGEVLKLVALRLAMQVALALVAAFGILGPVFGLEPRFQLALVTLLILPPPYIVPLFMKNDAATADERRFVYKALTVHTAASLAVFTALLAVFPTL
jgi:malate permease and related proteins